MRKTFLLLLLSFFASTQVFAHVTNEETVYSDIAYSEAAADILLLDMLGVISAESGSQEFRPLDPLLTSEFTAWMTGTPYEEKVPDQLENGAVSYGLVNTVLFEGQLELETAEQTMTREEFAAFVADHAEMEISGMTLFERAGFAEGPSGSISKVIQSENGHRLEIEGKTYDLGIHPRIQSASLDPAVWEGMEITNSWLGPDQGDGQSIEDEQLGTEAIQYAVIGQREIHQPSSEQQPEEAVTEAVKSDVLVKEDLDEEAGKVNGTTVLAVVCVALLVYWINKKKKREIE